MIDLAALELSFVGFWDCCFFSNSNKYSGIIVEDKEGNIKNLSYFELHTMMKDLNNG